MSIAEQIKNLDREDLEKKFVNLFEKFNAMNDTEKKESLIDVNSALLPENGYKDFSIHKNKRRQQYLHKTYTKNATALNFLLNELIEKNDLNLQQYFNNLNKKLEKKAKENHDTAPE
ncbi:hypothetical protein KJ870_07125 [bacterium]|nr:hypothetical protein [bacterium]MBU1434691.1 hypothetical protein [bacterium]MBU1502679.1 hypothetical protein [bacterium]